MYNSDKLRKIVNDLNINEGRSTSRSILERLAEYDFETLTIRKVLLELKKELLETQSGSLFNSGGFNVIPSDTGSKCNEFCVVFLDKLSPITKSHGEQNVDQSVTFNDVFTHWFKCLKVNQETLILVERDKWNEGYFDAYLKKVVDAYVNFHERKVYIVSIGKASWEKCYPY